MSNNSEGWTVTVEKQEGATSLAEALHALIAEDPDQGVRMGWLHSSLQRAAGGEPGYVRLYELHVSPEFRQRGVARDSFDELFARVPDQEITCLRGTGTRTEYGLSSDSHTSLGPTKCQGVAVLPVTWCAHR